VSSDRPTSPRREERGGEDVVGHPAGPGEVPSGTTPAAAAVSGSAARRARSGSAPPRRRLAQ
jgi:hypothetical protein